MMLGFRALFLSLIMAVAVLGTVPPSHADETDFFKSRNMTWIVSTDPGSGHDFYARLISRHMEANLPGATS